jgi:hypothetical protein
MALSTTSVTMKEITKAKLDKYFDVSSRAIAKVKLQTKAKINVEEAAKDFLDMATRYFADAEHFAKKNDYVNAFAALNYAHGWLDAGARIGLFDVGGDNVLFTVDEDHVKKFK